VFTGPAIQQASAQTLTDSVTVNATAGLGTIGSDAMGLNTAVYDGYMNDTPIPGFLQAAGIGALRFPGGSYSDIYNWQTNTAQGGYVAPGNGFSSFMTTAKAVGAEPIITVNYGTGTPALAGTLSWPASSPGTYPVAGYQVYQQGSGGSSTLVGTTTTTSFSLTGLTIGDSYTYNVVAVDSHGNPSLPSPPVTFTVPPPKNSSCAVHYMVNSSWGGGFNAAITMTNNGSTAISPWQLTFSFPASGEAVQGGWDGTWSQSGQQVTVTAASWNSTIAAGGGSVSIGFNGTDTGQDPAPTAFYINGTVCASD
jgi:Cellulose binding domain/Fibronectin type III domain